MGFDRMLGIANGVVDALDQILPPGEESDEREVSPRASRYARRPPKQESARSPRSQSAFAARVAATMPASHAEVGAPSSSTAISVRPRGRFRLVEATSSEGASVWVVTDGQESAVCSCKWLAERVQGALG